MLLRLTNSSQSSLRRLRTVAVIGASLMSPVIIIIFTLERNRAKALRVEQNQRAYSRKHGRKGPACSSPSVSAPLVPSHIQQTAEFPLPTSYLFLEATRSADALDESELSVWDSLPPYDAPAPRNAFVDRTYTENLMDVMHGRRLRQARERQAARACIAEGQGRDEAREEILGLIVDGEQRYAALEAVLRDYDGCDRHVRIAHLNLQWVARDVCMLYDELSGCTPTT